MNNKDFDEIGQRLYDLEADPPHEGWKKIAPRIKSGARPGKVVSIIRRDWWKPLVLLIPFFTWWIFADESITPTRLSSNIVETITPKTRVDQKQPEELPRNSAPAPWGKSGEKKIPVDDKRALPADVVPIGADDYSQDIAPSVTDARHANVEVLTVKDTSHHISAQVTEELEPVIDEPKISEPELPARVDLADDVEMTDTLQTRDEKENRKTWRVSFAFFPQYVSRSLKPVINDDVFITKIEDRRTTPLQKVGVAFAAGVGRSLSEQWYVDAQLTYAETGQHIYYSWSNGTVDTLMAVRHADQTISIKPVLEEYIDETRSHYTHTGVRIGATHYFWPTERRRFSFSTFVGFNYLLSAKVEEKTPDGWRQLGNADLNKMNYSLFASVGYNLKLSHSWELTISPSINYNMRQVKNGALPYSVSQRSTGVMLMVAKKL